MIDQSLFADVADILGIAYPAIVEKDYFAVQLLKIISSIEIDEYQFIFSGGTCLSKAYTNTYRMSEDLDLKLIPKEGTLRLSRTKQRESRGEIRKCIKKLIEDSDNFSLVNKPEVRNEGKFQSYQIQYPKKYDDIVALRAELQLEITESSLLDDANQRSLQSLYAKELGIAPEIISIKCVTELSIASEKLVALLRRTALWERNNSNKDDERLVRHAYDLFFLREIIMGNIEKTRKLVTKVINIDKAQFGQRHLEFFQNPNEELRYGLQRLKENPIYSKRYLQFTGPLVYSREVISWNQSITVLQEITDLVL
jgi:predicted nucleotidyltransferase component of viral defense system